MAVAALLGLLVWRLLRDRTAALLAATLFALHPAQAESVAWVTVPDPLMSACVLGATILYLKHAATRRPSDPVGKKSRKPSRGNETVRASVPTLVASVSLYFLALLAKETAIVVPVIIFALALITRQNDPPPNRTGKSADAAFVSPLRKAIREILPFAVVTVLYLLLRFHAFGGKFGSLTQHLPWSTVILSWPATLWFYVKVLAWPVRSHAFADPTLTARFSFDRVLLPGLGVACAVGILAAGWFWVLSKARRDLPAREASGVESSLVIGTLLLILPILPALHLNALNPGDFLHGRYTYLPCAGLMLLIATAWHLSGKLRIPLLCAAALLAICFGVFTVLQEQQWKDDLTVFTVAHDVAPHNAPVAQNLANAHVQAALQLADDGRCNEAIPVFQQVTQEFPRDWYAWASLGVCFVQVNDLPKAGGISSSRSRHFSRPPGDPTMAGTSRPHGAARRHSKPIGIFTRDLCIRQPQSKRPFRYQKTIGCPAASKSQPARPSIDLCRG